MAQKISKKVNIAVKKYIDAVREDIPIEKVILYGSHAKGIAKKNSDIDIAIISKKFGKNYQEEGKFLFRKLWDVAYSDIEPIGYSPKDFDTLNPSPLLAEIKKYGREIRV